MTDPVQHLERVGLGGVTVYAAGTLAQIPLVQLVGAIATATLAAVAVSKEVRAWLDRREAARQARGIRDLVRRAQQNQPKPEPAP